MNTSTERSSRWTELRNLRINRAAIPRQREDAPASEAGDQRGHGVGSI